MIKNFKCYLKNKIAAVLIAGATGITCVGCTNKNSNVNDVTVYISEETNDFVPYEDYPFEYKVTKYDCNKYKGTKCYFGDSFKSYDIKCTPIEFKNYFSCTNCTWETIFKAVEESPFDEYHKKLLNNGLINLKNNNFNMDLTVLYYNLKKI